MHSLSNVGFYIPTYKRGVEKQKTYNELPFYIKRRTRFVVDKSEAKEFRKAGKIMVAKCEIGIGNTRQYVIDNAKEKYIFFMDDDCQFSVRKDGKLIRAKINDVGRMFILLCRWLKTGEVGQVGCSYRSLNFTTKDDYKEVGNVYSMFGFDRELFNSLGLICNRSQFLEDMAITLGLLSKGYKNRITYKYAISQKPGIPGGCNAYRNSKKQKEAVMIVHKLFPKYTSLIRRPDREGWGDYDLRVQWRKAYLEGCRARGIKTGISKHIR